LRRTRDWVIESMDTDDIARRIGDSIDMSDIVSSMNLNNDTIFSNPGFLRLITENARFRTLVNQAVSNIHDSMSITDIIEDKINNMTVNIANDVAEKVLTVIVNKIGNSDV
jgi:dTDP-4-dehydrorhamnose reductase